MIQILSGQIPTRFLCNFFSICPSSYYYWLNAEETPRFVEKNKIVKLINEIFESSRETYGSPRIYHELRSRGITVSENTVAKYMRELGLNARLKRKFKVQMTDSNHDGPIAPRVFKTEDCNPKDYGPGELLAGDITYLKLGPKFLYLAVVMDLSNREIVGWSMSNGLETSLVLRALESAMYKTGPDAEIIFHSDRGSQYASEAYRNFLKNNEITPSMSRKGNCYDNAYVESWFASLKNEWIRRSTYSTEKELRGLVFEYIEIWYNKKRRHSSLDYLSPEEYRITNQKSA